MPIRRVRVDLLGTVGGTGVMTLYFTDVEATTAADTMGPVGTFLTALGAVTCSPLTYSTQGTIDILSEVDGSLISSITGTGPTAAGALSSGDSIPPANQGVLKLATGAVVGGQRLEGRLFVPNPARASTGATIAPTSAYRTALQNAAAALITNTTSTGPWVVWSRKNGTTRAVTAGVAWTKFGVLRSRRD